MHPSSSWLKLVLKRWPKQPASQMSVTILKVAKLQGALDHNESKIVNARLLFLVVAIPLCKQLLCSQESSIYNSLL